MEEVEEKYNELVGRWWRRR